MLYFKKLLGTMSDYSGYSSASRMEIERLRAVLVANGISDGPIQGTSAQAQAQDQAQARVRTQAGHQPSTQTQGPRNNQVSHSQPQPQSVKINQAIHGTRKRHSSNQLGGNSKGCRINDGETINRFNILTHSSSYPDKSMKPSSIPSTPGGYCDTYAKKTGMSHNARIQGDQPQSTSNGAHTNADFQDVIYNNDLEAEAIYTVNNDGAFREELTIHFLTINGEKFHGSITYQEAKHIVFKDCLGFGDFSNFGGARVGFKGAPTVTFKLVSAINVDELYHLQKFEFVRKSSRQGRSHSDVIGCKIAGLRQPDHKQRRSEQGVISNGVRDDGTRKIEIQGCEYRIPKETLVDYLSFFGEILSDIKEILFDDGSDPITPSNGLNRTGNYCVKIKLSNDLPELLPILGKRIKIVYPGIQRLCPNCFGPHAKARCQSRKTTWPEYIDKFKAKYPELNKGLVDRPIKTPALPVDLPETAQSSVKADEAMAGSSESNYTNDWSNNQDKTTENLIDMDTETSVRIDPPTETNPNPKPPSKSDFLVPINAQEYIQMTNQLIMAGQSKADADLIISSRKKAFYKANSDFKKSLNVAMKTDSKKNSRTSNPVIPNQPLNGV